MQKLTHTLRHTHTRTLTHTHIRTHTYTHIYTNIHTHTYIHSYMLKFIYSVKKRILKYFYFLKHDICGSTSVYVFALRHNQGGWYRGGSSGCSREGIKWVRSGSVFSTEARQVSVYRAFCHLPWGPFCRPSPKQS